MTFFWNFSETGFRQNRKLTTFWSKSSTSRKKMFEMLMKGVKLIVIEINEFEYQRVSLNLRAPSGVCTIKIPKKRTKSIVFSNGRLPHVESSLN